MKYLLLSLLVVAGFVASAQKHVIKGQLVDSLGQSLPNATVLLLNPKDSSLVNFSVGDSDGNFQIKNVNKGEHLFKVTFLGFEPLTKKVIIDDGSSPIIELGRIKMLPASKELKAVEVVAEKAPVTVRHDTIEFNAGSFKTKPNAVVEDLIKKLPGIEVDNDGNITAQGEQVKRVTIDGKNFFGTDPKLATKNLPADAIDKVQLFDKKSDQALFSGIDDGQREKTINLELKEEKRNGAFGTIMAGVGTDDRMQGRANINKFSKSTQFSFLGMGNNINEQGFSIDDYMNFTGGAQQMMRGGPVRIEINGDNSNGVPLNLGNRANGIMTTYAAGLNFNNQFNPKTELNGSYFYNHLDHNKDQSLFRQNTLPGASFNLEQDSRQQNTNDNHRANFTLDHKLDSVNSLKLNGSFSFNTTDGETKSTSRSVTPDGTLQNSSDQLYLSNGTNLSFNSSLLWRHKFKKKGRTLSTTALVGITDNQRKGYLDAINNFFGSEPNEQILKQSNDQSTRTETYSGTFSYTEPIGRRKYLEANYNYRQNRNTVDRDVYDMNGSEAIFNGNLSNEYSSNYQYHRGGLNFRMNKSKYSLLVGASAQKTLLHGNLKTEDINKSYENILPAVRFNYDFSTTKHLGFDYETSVQEPTIQQLQPVLDNSDVLNPYIGNPQLRPSYLQSWRLHFNTFNPMNFISFFAFLDVDYTRNAITNGRSVENFVTLTKPVNVDFNRQMTADAHFNFPIQSLHSRLSVGGNYRTQQSINLLNEVPSEINQQTIGGDLRYNYRYKEILDMNLSANKNFQMASYQYQQNDQLFINSTYSSEINLSFLKNYQFTSSFEYLQYENRKTNFSQDIALVNFSASRYFLKNKVGELRIGVNNLLNKALGVSQTTDVNYVQRQTTNSLGRYFMVSFIYALNKQLNPMGMGRPERGVMRVLRQ